MVVGVGVEVKRMHHALLLELRLDTLLWWGVLGRGRGRGSRVLFSMFVGRDLQPFEQRCCVCMYELILLLLVLVGCLIFLIAVAFWMILVTFTYSEVA